MMDTGMIERSGVTTSSFVMPEIFYQASTEEDVFPSSVVFCIFCFSFSLLILRRRLSVFPPGCFFLSFSFLATFK